MIEFLKDQSVVTRYKHILPLLQQEIQPRGVWYRCNGIGPLMPPVYQDGLHAFRCINSVYLAECMHSVQRSKLRGILTSLVSKLNQAYFGHVKELYFVIQPSQADQFARLAVRLLLIDQLAVKLVKPSWYDAKYPEHHLCIDLRKQDLTTVRKLLRWKKQYSPAFDGVIPWDRVDQLIAGEPRPEWVYVKARKSASS